MSGAGGSKIDVLPRFALNPHFPGKIHRKWQSSFPEGDSGFIIGLCYLAEYTAE